MVTRYEQRKSGLVVPVVPLQRPSQAEICREYTWLHCCCPECGGDHHEQTCIGFLFTSVETTEDRNSSRCLDCGWSGIVHDLVPTEPRPEKER